MFIKLAPACKENLRIPQFVTKVQATFLPAELTIPTTFSRKSVLRKKKPSVSAFLASRNPKLEGSESMCTLALLVHEL